ncbi:MAG: class I SAM-dependent methyltransferase [Thermodesulfovibrionia bacterium]|nr:class I SAM-dependent methyltransferase [Thermodesulfovibrionia bacterium]
MKRIPENELMNDTAQAQAYAEADFSEPHDAFVAHFSARFPDFSNGEVLDLGCGPADVTLRFARAFPKTHITGIDGAQAMLNIALSDVQSQGLTQQITLRKCTLPDKNLLKHGYDALISNSLLHHLSEPVVMWQTIGQCAKSGAAIFVMDLLRPMSVENAKELVEKYAADASPILQKDFYNSLLAAYSTEEIQQQLQHTGLDCLTIKVVSDRHWIAWGIKRK